MQAAEPLAKYKAFMKEKAAEGVVQFEVKGESSGACPEDVKACIASEGVAAGAAVA
jgi:hypothetical protein